ncbi:MAG: haloacid dehalogenase [Gemmatimonadota bacterium]|nr:haloacid dehalogenase [Gemmatimonadota bacterium]
MRLCDFPILTFDTYGTLIDWETGIWDALQPLCSRLDDPPTRETALTAFAEVESACQVANPDLLYADLLAATHRMLTQNWGGEPDDAESIRFGQSVGDWPAFVDAVESLVYLKQHHRLITLTNCDRASYRGSAARLGDPWDAIFTAEEIGSYKPSLANFEFLLARVAADFDGDPGSILHIAQSLFHDHVPSKAIGLETVWIDRRAGRGGGATAPPQEAVEPNFRFKSMAELVAQHRAERAAAHDAR